MKMSNFYHRLSKVFCRLAPSPIHGVGVFAIVPIPKGTNPMQECREVEFEYISVSKINTDAISEPVKKLIRDMCPENDGVYEVPEFTLNEIGLSYYLNHSKTPNMNEDGDGNFVATRDIEPGEELTVDYGTYGELNL